MATSNNEYQCAACKGIFTKAWSDEEADAESKAIWGEIPPENQAVICDDCYQKMHPAEHLDIYETVMRKLREIGGGK